MRLRLEIQFMFVLNKSRCQYLTESCSSRSSYPTGVVFNAGQERPTWALYTASSSDKRQDQNELCQSR